MADSDAEEFLLYFTDGEEGIAYTHFVIDDGDVGEHLYSPATVEVDTPYIVVKQAFIKCSGALYKAPIDW